jgi:hypothetical protein
MRQWIQRFGQEIRAQVDRARGGPEVHQVRGLRVVVTNPRPDIETEFVLRRLDDALALIERYQPWRLAHLRRDLGQISVAPFPCRGAYLPGDRTVLTELSFLARSKEFTPAQIASSIVHEGVHARVHRLGERWEFDQQRRDPAREERLCRRAELAFGVALPADVGAAVIDRARGSLQLGDEEVAPVIDWAAAHAVKRQADAEAVRAWELQGKAGR